MSRLKIFLSYSIKDKVIAGNYKKHLEIYYGFEVFVAHDDNIPSTDWAVKIKNSISSADIFLVLISKNSKPSVFVNQEIGVAWGLGVKIFPIKMDITNPFGFIANIHGFPCKKDQEEAILRNGSMLFSILTSKEKEFLVFKDIAIESAIYALSNSQCFRDTRIIVRTLVEIERQVKFNKKHLDLLKSAVFNNYQVYGEMFSYPDLKKLLADKYDLKELR